jgi:hypothetical protein
MNPIEYIHPLSEGSNPQEYEQLGYTIYTKPDGITHYAVELDAPEEAHHLANGAAQGDPDAINEILSLNLD